MLAVASSCAQAVVDLLADRIDLEHDPDHFRKTARETVTDPDHATFANQTIDDSQEQAVFSSRCCSPYRQSCAMFSP